MPATTTLHGVAAQKNSNIHVIHFSW